MCSKIRNFIANKELQIFFVRVAGFLIILAGIVLIIKTVLSSNNPSVLAAAFFITMLGFAFAFPSLLKDDSNSLSTMRIVVFMMTNVICMLLIKIGWQSSVDSFAKIGIDWNWVGVIGLVFGAKAVQSFSENKK